MKPESFTLILNSIDGVSNLVGASVNNDRTYTVNPYSFLGGSVNEIKPQLYKIDVKLLTGFNNSPTIPPTNLYHVIINTGSKINQMVGTNNPAGIFLPLYKSTASNVGGVGTSTNAFKGDITVSGLIPSNQIRVKFFITAGNTPLVNVMNTYILTMTYTPIFDDNDLI